MDIHPPHAIHSWKDFGIQLVTITAGILIALSLEGVRESVRDRALVREARDTIALELADNKKGLDGQIAGVAERKKNYATALRFADELLKRQTPTEHNVNMGVNFADLSEAGWQTAERTGALSHMDYAEVQKLAQVYTMQEMFVQQQQRYLERLSATTAILVASGNPMLAPLPDVERFRQQVITLGGDLLFEEQLARQLSERYAKALKQE